MKFVSRIRIVLLTNIYYRRKFVQDCRYMHAYILSDISPYFQSSFVFEYKPEEKA